MALMALIQVESIENGDLVLSGRRTQRFRDTVNEKAKRTEEWFRLSGVLLRENGCGFSSWNCPCPIYAAEEPNH